MGVWGNLEKNGPVEGTHFRILCACYRAMFLCHFNGFIGSGNAPCKKTCMRQISTIGLVGTVWPSGSHVNPPLPPARLSVALTHTAVLEIHTGLGKRSPLYTRISLHRKYVRNPCAKGLEDGLHTKKPSRIHSKSPAVS